MKKLLNKASTVSREESRLWTVLSVIAWSLPVLAFTGIPGSLIIGIGAPVVIWLLAMQRVEGRWKLLPKLSLWIIGFVIAAIILYVLVVIVNFNNMVKEKHGSIPTQTALNAGMTAPTLSVVK